MAKLSLKNIKKIYPNGFKAVKNLDLEIDDKEFLVLVGPSGCGKSTTLRMIAGLEEISDGEMYIGDRLINNVSPKDRDIAMVFQNYALYPHMTVFDNMAFGLKLRKKSKKEIDESVNTAAKSLGIEELLDRKPKQLSGGQRQRVALGRAIVRQPKVFLMDEPLSNLDAKLRVQMRAELSALHRSLQTTFIYVTHDQTEAMTMGTRIVVMKDGVIQQVADPKTVYTKPANMFVASFIGSPQINFIDCKIVENGYGVYAEFDGRKVVIPSDKAKIIKDNNYVGKDVVLGIRPEGISVKGDKSNTEDAPFIKANVQVAEMLGSETNLHLKVDDKVNNIIARIKSSKEVEVGDNIEIQLMGDKIHIFDKESEIALF